MMIDSEQEELDFGEPLAPHIVTRMAPARVHSPRERIPGVGRHVTTCKRCARTRRRKRPSDFCSDGCRFAHRHEEQGAIEQRKKARAMKGSASINREYLEIARAAARLILRRDGDADADRVRLYLEEHGTVLPSGGWWGSIFLGAEWTWTGRLATCKHKGSKCRQVKVWELRQ